MTTPQPLVPEPDQPPVPPNDPLLDPPEPILPPDQPEPITVPEPPLES